MGNSIKLLFMLVALLSAPPALAADSSYSSYEDCLEHHRQGLEDRHYEQNCKGSKAAECQKTYGEDYLKEIEKCRSQFSQSESKVTFPKNNEALDCSAESKSDMQALGDSCQSLGQTTTSRCDPSEAQRIISLASQKSTSNMQSSGASTTNACQQAGQFNQEASTALQSFQSKCEPAISEGQSVCDRARSIVSRSSCSASLKARYTAAIDQGVNMFSQHRATLSDAQRSVQAAQNGQSDASKCAAQAAAAANDAAKDDPKASDSSTTAPSAAESSTTTSTAPPPSGAGGESVAANAAGRAGDGAAMSQDNAEQNSATHLWDLPSTPKEGDGAGGGLVGSDLGAPKAKDDSDAAKSAAVASKLAAAKAGTSRGGAGGRGGGRVPAPLRGKLDGLAGGRDPASLGKAGEMPDLRAFLPGSPVCAPEKGKDGLTGPHCEQWQKIHFRYDNLLDGSEP